MVDIISKRDGPRTEDAAARDYISRNGAAIRQLADRLSGGAYSAGLTRPPKAPETETGGLITHDLGASRAIDAAQPYIKVSVNNRVVMADLSTGRQLEFLGEIRRSGQSRQFRLARRSNGFHSDLDAGLAEKLADLDGATVGRERSEKQLAAEIGARLGIT